MKTKTRPGLQRILLKLLTYNTNYYIDLVAELEKALARRPRKLHLDMIGDGEIPADMALLIRSILVQRSPRTRLVTNARSSLLNGAVLVWLLGDQRTLREDARVFFRRVDVPEEPDEDDCDSPAEPAYADSYSDEDPEVADYAEVLKRINEFLPVQECAGRAIGVSALRQFCIVDNEKLDQWLATAFGVAREASGNQTKDARSKGAAPKQSRISR